MAKLAHLMREKATLIEEKKDLIVENTNLHIMVNSLKRENIRLYNKSEEQKKQIEKLKKKLEVK